MSDTMKKSPLEGGRLEPGEEFKYNKLHVMSLLSLRKMQSEVSERIETILQQNNITSPNMDKELDTLFGLKRDIVQRSLEQLRNYAIKLGIDNTRFDELCELVDKGNIENHKEDPKADAINLLHKGDHEGFKLWKEAQNGRLDLSGIDFTGLDLTNFDLSGIDLTGAILVNIKGLSPIMLSSCILFGITVDRITLGMLNAATTEVRKSWNRVGDE